MKRFLLFKGLEYYPSGGWDDFVKDFDTRLEALLFVGELGHYEWFHVVDITKGAKVARGGRSED